MYSRHSSRSIPALDGIDRIFPLFRHNIAYASYRKTPDTDLSSIDRIYQTCRTTVRLLQRKLIAIASLFLM